MDSVDDLIAKKALVKSVFISGGVPDRTYVYREEVENALINSINTSKLISITGHTKTGKTVLTYAFFEKPCFSSISVIRLECGAIKNESDFWQFMIEGAGLGAVEEDKVTSKEEVGASGTAYVQGVFGFFSAKSGGSISAKNEVTVEQKRVISTNSKNKVLDFLHKNRKKIVIIIDDFHYVNNELKRVIVRALKPLILQGLNVIVISIPGRQHDAVVAEREMGGRISPIEVKSWSMDDLVKIAKTGFNYIGKDVDMRAIETMAKESFGSPHLMQGFCLDLSLRLIDKDAFSASMLCPDNEELQQIFRKSANTIGRPIFTQLVQGPRRETSRKPRRLVEGVDVDIYGLVAKVFILLKPGMGKVPQADIMQKIKEIVVPEDVPQFFEVTRVLKKMQLISVSDSASNPVIDLDEAARCVYITDPYFAYYLKWGDCSF